MKVLVLVPSLRIGNGISSFIMAYFRSLNHDTVQMDFAYYTDFPETFIPEVTAAGSNVFKLPHPVKKYFAHIRECRRILRVGNYDIVHDNSFIVTLPMMFVAKKCVRKRVLHSHSSKLGDTRKSAFRNAIFVPMLRHCATDFAACSDVAGRFLFGRRPYRIISNVVHSAAYDFSSAIRTEMRRALGVADRTVIGSVCALVQAKNLFFALDVVSVAVKKRADVIYLIAGSGPLEDEIRRYIKTLGIEQNVRLLGNRSDACDLYQAMDVCLFPSKFEGLGITAVEAQISGLPVIASDAIPREVAFSDLVTFLPLSESAGFWAERIIELLNALPERRGHADELLRSQFSDVGAGERLESYYRELLRDWEESE